MKPMRKLVLHGVLFWLLSINTKAVRAMSFDVAGYDIACGVDIRSTASQITLQWPIADNQRGQIVLNLDPKLPLIERIGELDRPILTDIDPVFLLTVGTRDLNLPSGWVAFFDDPPKRPHQTYRVMRETKSVKGEQ